MNKKIYLGAALSVLLLFSVSCAAGKSPQAAEQSVSTGPNYVTNISPVPKDKELELVIETSGKLQYTVFKLDNPMRLIIDMPDIDSSAFTVPVDLPTGVASRVSTKYSVQTGNSRVEVELNKPVMYNVTRLTDRKIVVSMKPFERARELGPEREINPGEVEITAIELREVSGLARVLISYAGDKPVFKMVRKPEMNRVVIDIENAKVKVKNEKLLSVERKDSIVASVALFQFTMDPPIVKIVANLHEFTPSNVFEREGRIIFDIGSDAILAKASEIKEEKKEVVMDISEEKVKGPEDYAGRRITLDFQEANIKNLLRIIADVSDLNIITSESVKGKVTMKLKDVPWDLALDIILRNNKLGMVRTGNIIRVATQEELAKEKEVAATGIKTEVEAEPLFLKVFQINYESADKLKANLDSIKSSRGSIDINTRTNTLIVQDIRDRLAEMERLIEILDKRTVQVLIEARIVEVTHNYAKELGIRWGGRINTQANLGFPATIGLSGVSGGSTGNSAAGGIVNLATSGAATGALGLKLGSINGTALLDMQLSALENQGKGKILSMPKITTMDNVEALIESGREIPYQTTSSDGTKTEFKKATLSLKVTPHVSPDEYIRLEIEAKKDEADFANQLPNSPPPILTKHAKTEVIIKNGDTTVIGGLFKENKAENQASVPLFSKIPVIGWLFKNKLNTSDGEELLIFITPKIL